VILGVHPHDEGEIVSHRLSHGSDDFLPEAQSILQGAAVLIVAVVGVGGEKLVDQVAVAEGHLNGVEARFADPAGSLTKATDIGGDFLQGQRARSHLIGQAEHIGGGDTLAFRHQLGIGHSAGVVNMGHDPPTGGANGVGQAAQAAHQALLVNAQLGGKLAATGVDVKWLGGDEAHASLRPSHVEGNVALCHVALRGAVAQLDSGHQHAVGQIHLAYRQRLEQKIRVCLFNTVLGHVSLYLPASSWPSVVLLENPG
jgi:hypothetical protein